MNSLQTIRAANRMVGSIAPDLTANFARRMLMTPHPHRPHAWEDAALERAEPITFRFGLGGLRWGEGGPIVLAMHGWSGRPTQFAGFIEPLLAAGRQVIALEAPAHGRSPGREAHVFSFVEAMLEASAELKGIESVIGHSMGGAAALYAAHLGMPVQRVVTIGAPAALRRVLVRFAGWLALPEAATARFLEAVNRHVGVDADELDIERWAGQLGFDGLVIHDRDDREVPFAEALAMASAWPQARSLHTLGLGHGRILADQGVIDAASAFLVGSAGAQRRAA
jgi:pimeloyl-ACP methyl ester carboxylesterase